MKRYKKESHEFRTDISIIELLASGYSIEELVSTGLLKKQGKYYTDGNDLYNEKGQKINNGKTV